MKTVRTICMMAIVAGLALGCSKPAPPSGEGPYGLSQGMTFDEYVAHYKPTDLTPGKMSYETYEVPKPDKRVMHYQLGFGPDGIGLCEIIAHGKAVVSSSDGKALKENYLSFLHSLESEYGPAPNKYDFVSTQSAFKENNEWMQALFSKSRVLAAYWKDQAYTLDRRENKIELPHHLESIAIATQAFNQRKGNVTIIYRFENYSDCVEANRVDTGN